MDDHYGWICPRCGKVHSPTTPQCLSFECTRGAQLQQEHRTLPPIGLFDDTLNPDNLIQFYRDYDGRKLQNADLIVRLALEIKNQMLYRRKDRGEEI